MQSKIHDCYTIHTQKIRAMPSLLTSVQTTMSFLYSAPQACSLQTLQICYLIRLPRPLPRKLCVSQLCQSSFLSWPHWFLREALISCTGHACHVSHCLIGFITLSIRSPSLSHSLCCCSAPLEGRLWKCHATQCLDTCREQAFKLCLCEWLSANQLCSSPDLVISILAST